MKKAGFNIIDLSFALQAQTKRRNRDGIHWSPAENRSSYCPVNTTQNQISNFVQADDKHYPHSLDSHLAFLGTSSSPRQDEGECCLDQAN